MTDENTVLIDEPDIPRNNLTTQWFITFKNRYFDARRDIDKIWKEIIAKVNTNPKTTAYLDENPIIFEHDRGHDFVMLIKCKEGTQRGLNRSYWSDKTAFGFKQFQEYRLEKVDTCCGDKA